MMNLYQTMTDSRAALVFGLQMAERFGLKFRLADIFSEAMK
jgi:hypothetical protein